MSDYILDGAAIAICILLAAILSRLDAYMGIDLYSIEHRLDDLVGTLKEYLEWYKKMANI